MLPSRSPAPLADSIPRPEVAGYVLSDFLGRGGSGMVWRATQEGTLREVALKFLAPWQEHGLAGLRFAREAEIAASLEHVNIARIYDSGESAGGPWLAMELVEGPSLSSWVAEHKPTLRERVALFRHVCAGVRHAHQRGVIHRDLKPGNVLVTPDGTPKIVDFGLACRRDNGSLDVTLTRQGEVFGSLAWMAPEQAAARWSEVDVLTDVHALGAILYSLLAGSPPLNSGLPPGALLAAAQSGTRLSLQDSPGVPKDLAAIADKCMAPEKSRRYPSVASLESDAGRWLSGEPVQARSSAPLYWLGKKVRRHRVAVVGMIVLGLSAAGLGWGYFQGQRARDREKREASEREAAQTARTLHEAQELVSLLLVEMRPKLEEAGHAEWFEEAQQRVAAFPWDIGGSGLGAYDPRRFRARTAAMTGELLAHKGQWGGALVAWNEAVDILKVLATEFPEAAVFRQELGHARLGQEVALLKLGFHNEAVEAGKRALLAMTPPPGEAVSPALLSEIAGSVSILTDATFSAKGKRDDALDLVNGAARLLPVIERPEDMTEEQAGWHARVGREEARLTAALKGPDEADAIAVRASACARWACTLSGSGESAARVLALALATEADIARARCDLTRAGACLAEATEWLAGKSVRAPLTLSDAPFVELAAAWDRQAVWMEQAGRFHDAIEADQNGMRLWSRVSRRRPGVASFSQQARLHLRDARLSRQVNDDGKAAEFAIRAASRFRRCVEDLHSEKWEIHFGWAESALILAELNAAPSPAGTDWSVEAAAALRRPRQQSDTLGVQEKCQLSELEQRLANLSLSRVGNCLPTSGTTGSP